MGAEDTMILIQDIDNPLTDSNAPNQAEVHMKPGDILTVIAPGGDEIVIVLSDGTVYDPFNQVIKTNG